MFGPSLLMSGTRAAFGSWNRDVKGFPRRGGPSVHKPQLGTKLEQETGAAVKMYETR
jgi:hypothetical protein